MVGDYNLFVIPTERILQQLLHADHLLGVEAAPRARFPRQTPAPAMSPPVRPAPAPARWQAPEAVRRPAPAAAPVAPVATQSGDAAWQVEVEIPLVPGTQAAAPLAVLFVSLEWGPPLTGETRILFDRQVAAMKVPPASAGLLRLAWPGAQEPTPEALAEAKAKVLTTLDAHPARVAVLFGGFSAKALTGVTSLTLARGRWFSLQTPSAACPACVTWHPSQLGVDRDRRMQTWDDLQKVMAKLAE